MPVSATAPTMAPVEAARRRTGRAAARNDVGAEGLEARCLKRRSMRATSSWQSSPSTLNADSAWSSQTVQAGLACARQRPPRRASWTCSGPGRAGRRCGGRRGRSRPSAVAAGRTRRRRRSRRSWCEAADSLMPTSVAGRTRTLGLASAVSIRSRVGSPRALKVSARRLESGAVGKRPGGRHAGRIGVENIAGVVGVGGDGLA